ncbi:DUF4148 domain-containing protein [Robbsia sp. Bb-Pol-6]|uniref:DUF4148 domain-containing protein n=1 Tax=Robbsia betulipollinis TaxID=2981849 RepID=A0ABT3ZT09_9BURK|nr:DUF4148 domain-containing protein [Robbsia betulipollinis]MCY0389701.1 DUF4148 domain-containing protein [Robbsia betulipollinis]
MKKILIPAAFAVAALTLSGVASAQDNNNVTTRSQVNANLVQFTQAGYTRAGDQTQYPNNMLQAEANIPGNDQSYGGSASGSSYSGTRGGSMGGANWQSVTKP